MDAILVLLEAAALFGVLYLVVKKAVKDAIRESRTKSCFTPPARFFRGSVPDLKREGTGSADMTLTPPRTC